MAAVFDDLVMLLNAGISQRRMYFGNHPKVQACAGQFVQDLRELLRASGQEAFFVGVADGKLIHEGHYLLGSTIAGRKLIDFAERLRCGGFLFRADVAPAEMTALFDAAAALEEPVASLAAARALLAQRGVTRVQLSPPHTDASWFGARRDGQAPWAGELVDRPGFEPLVKAYQTLFHLVETTHGQARGDRPPDADAARVASEQMIQRCEGGFTDVMQIVRYPDYDTYTVGHSVRVAMIAVLVGTQLGLERAILTELGAAGLLHDVGKAKVPEEILFKTARLDRFERSIVEKHAEIGARLIIEDRRAGPYAVAAAWGHHLRHDGGGYPPCAPWSVRSQVTELIHLCDVFEALTAVRPYKAAHAPRRAYELMLEDPGEFDPAMLRLFVRTLGLYPPGSRVVLSSGERAVVVAPGPRLDQPRVQLTHARTGEALRGDARAVVPLGPGDRSGLAVARLLPDEGAPALGRL